MRDEGGVVGVESPAHGRWAGAGLAAWAAVGAVWALDVAFQYVGRGLPVGWALVNTAVGIAPGAALTPAVFLAFRRLGVAARPLAARAVLYVGVGVAFWLLWATAAAGLIASGLYLGPREEVAILTNLYRRVAGYSFNSLILYSVMVFLHEAVQRGREARRLESRARRLQTELVRARTAALEAQLNPHFLFNTLHVAAGLAGTDAPAARRVLGDLGELLRASLAEGREQLVPLRDEARLLGRYAGIQNARFGDRLRVGFRLAPDTLGLGVPPLLLQPLLENAVVHGVAPREEGGHVEVRAAVDDGRLRLVVEDSGDGFPAGADSPPRERVGIGSTRARLELLFGDGAELRFRYPEAGGFAAEVELPAVDVGGAA